MIAPGRNRTGGSGTVAEGKLGNYSIASAQGQKLISDVTSADGSPSDYTLTVTAA